MKYLIENFIEDTNSANSADEIFSLYNKALIQFGYDRSIYTLLTDFPTIQQKAGHGIKSNYPSDWMDHYLHNNYRDSDPVITKVLRDNAPFTWDSLKLNKDISKAQIKIIEEGSEAGLWDGVGVPLYGYNGTLAGVGIASSVGNLRPDKNLLSKLKIITEQFHLSYCAIGGNKSPNYYTELTKREKEILKWWAIGKTSEEVAIILNCSKDTIKFHSKNIYAKLEANSKILAVTKSIRLGLIPLDFVKM
jgi:DNA-binding CsgD family transcriptional regulator